MNYYFFFGGGGRDEAKEEREKKRGEGRKRECLEINGGIYM